MRRLIVFLLVTSLAAPLVACEWDYDTLKMERARFPGALELIVGKFLRHSEPFYEWRVEDRRADIAAHDAGEKPLTDEQLARTYDDLAVALDKLKRHDEAIEMIREKVERLPEVGRYETAANLGTLLVHAGRYEEGLVELKKALEINPEAHFGRERYQVLLVEYVMEKRGEDGEISLPLDGSARGTERAPPFARWLLMHEGLMNDKGRAVDRRQAEVEVNRAVKGVLGMMRFGDHHSPILLEVLGDLLLTGHDIRDENHGERLAARAYLRAADRTESDEAKRAFRKMAADAVLTQHPEDDEQFWDEDEAGPGISLRQLEDQLRREVHEADTWFEQTIAYDEELWIEESVDPDAEFWGKYGDQVIRVGHDRLPAGRFASAGLPWGLRAALAGGALLTAAAVVGALVWRRRRPTGYEGGGV